MKKIFLIASFSLLCLVNIESCEESIKSSPFNASFSGVADNDGSAVTDDDYGRVAGDSQLADLRKENRWLNRKPILNIMFSILFVAVLASILVEKANIRQKKSLIQNINFKQ